LAARRKKQNRLNGGKPIVKPEHKKNDLNFITLNKDKQGKPFEVRTINTQYHYKGINMLTSNRWLRCMKSPNSSADLPYIDKLGRFTGSTIYRANISPQGFISTVVSTISKRLRFQVARHNPIHQCNIRQSLITKCAAYYALTKNSYFMDRFLVLSKNLRENYKTISSLLHRFSRKLDAHKWFVYGHVCLQTQWLTLRAARPRDKSALIVSESNFTLPASIRGSKSDITRFSYDAVWSCFTGMNLI
jgi:hypothetical protein